MGKVPLPFLRTVNTELLGTGQSEVDHPVCLSYVRERGRLRVMMQTGAEMAKQRPAEIFFTDMNTNRAAEMLYRAAGH
jgi:hypothetical protein